ncbi:MAG: LamG domain-containing protein [Phycisphaerae bacterium]|nr:LamG domain-containing protein [Phycisphaerae bacterium]
MKTQKTTRYDMIAALSVVILCGNLWAGGSFLDDFSDGNARDGSPAMWGWDNDGTGERLVTPEGFRLTAKPGLATWGALRDDEGNHTVYAGNLTIQMQYRVDAQGGWPNAGVAFRDLGPGDHYGAGIINNDLFLDRKVGGVFTLLGQVPIPGFSAAQQDVIIQVAVTDFENTAGMRTSRLEVYAWLPGQNEPAQPLISVVDATYAEGGIALYSEWSSATFRWVEVITDTVEPTEPVVDFNGDGTVDITDLVRMIESWGQEDPTVDIAPHPGGDSIVNVDDLEMLMSFWQQAIDDPTLKAHWTLDEADGAMACDSTGRNDAMVLGDPLWQCEGGQINGALQLDGIDDYLTAPFILDPVKQPFSVYAWIKGGQPGQTLMSQKDIFGGEWLSLDLAGALTTTLTFPLAPVTSDVVVTDDLWHHIGLVSDGAGISLYVDDIEVARSDLSPILPANSDLQIGTGKTREPGTFWSGMIDEVRIYNRVVTP